MVTFVVILVAIIAWTIAILGSLWYLRERTRNEIEENLRFKVSSASWSDKYIISLLDNNPHSDVLLQCYAANAAARHEWPEALRRAEAFLAQKPRVPGAWILTFDALRALKRDSEAEALLRKAARRLPRHFDILRVCARDAGDRGDWSAAVRYLRRAWRGYPNRYEGYTEGALALARAGECDQAEALLAGARQRLPEVAEIWCAEAKVAELAGAPQEALARWEAAIARFPAKQWPAYLGKAELLDKLGRREEAAAVLEQTKQFFPANTTVADALARLSLPAVP